MICVESLKLVMVTPDTDTSAGNWDRIFHSILVAGNKKTCPGNNSDLLQKIKNACSGFVGQRVWVRVTILV